MTTPTYRDGKASFDDVYDRPDPRGYVDSLSELEYQTPEHARLLLGPVIAAARRRSGGGAMVDLCCSYGINAALLNHDLTLDELYDRYRRPEIEGWTTAELVADDRAFYAARRRSDAVRAVGLDAAANAVDYALAVGLLDAGSGEDLEARDPSRRLRGALADTAIVTVTGGIGYITAATFDRVLGSVQGVVPWVAAFALRWIDMRPIADVLVRHGLVLEELTGHTFRQRRFADADEREFVHGELRRLDLATHGPERDGYHHTRFFLARTSQEVADTPLEELVAPALP